MFSISNVFCIMFYYEQCLVFYYEQLVMCCYEHCVMRDAQRVASAAPCWLCDLRRDMCAAHGALGVVPCVLCAAQCDARGALCGA